MYASFIAHLLKWYDNNAVELPWRRQDATPYHIWLSEIMLQQTQVNTVVDYYNRFLDHYPTINNLAGASLDEVLKRWEGLGYYSRARNLYKTAQIIADDYDGTFPKTVDELLKLPGIGRYTAGAIASIAFDVQAPVLDGNVIRIFSRLLDIDEDVKSSAVQNRLWEQAEEWVPEKRPGDYNQALMELGRTVCKPRNPLCETCPINSYCVAFANGTQAERPVKKRKPPTPHIDVTAAIIRDEHQRILIAQRPLEGLLGGLWEFPGGKQEEGETLEECLKREIKEELDIEIAVEDHFISVKHAFTHFKITLHTYECCYLGGEPKALGVHSWQWITEDDFDQFSFGKADRKVIAALKERGKRLL